MERALYEQMENCMLDAMEAGAHDAEKAYRFLLGIGQDERFAAHVRDCIRTHSIGRGVSPESLEAKILFDADKLDSVGALGIARTLVFRGERAEPLYTRAADSSVSDGTGDRQISFFREYKRELERIYGELYTARGAALAESRRATAEGFYRALLHEARETDEKGRAILRGLLQ